MQWLQKFFKKKTTCQGIVGISFLPNGIAVAVANHTKNNRMKLNHCEFIETQKTEERFGLLKKVLVAHNLSGYDCHLVLDINDYHRINIEAPLVPENEIALAIRWKINDFIDFPIDDAVIDYYPVPSFNGNTATVEVIACPGTVVKPLVEQCIQAGLQLKVIDIQETTLRNLAVLMSKDQHGVAVLYAQKSFSIILIQKDGVIYVARRIAIGYEKLDVENQFLNQSHAVMAENNLALEIRRSLDYVHSYYGMDAISGLAVIPWAVSTQELVNNLINNHGIMAYLMDLSTVLYSDIVLDYETQSLCAPVIGTTLRNSIATTA